jgi:hypothetical protein
MAVIAIVVRESRFREKATRFDEAVDRPLRCLVPTDIESEQLRKELQLAVWKIVMIHHAIACQLVVSIRSTNQGITIVVSAPMRPSLLRRSQVWRARFLSFEAQLRRCRHPKSLTSGDRYAERIAMRPNVACRGSRRFSQSPRPAAIASSGSSGKFDKPSIAAISLNKKSRMKKD